MKDLPVYELSIRISGAKPVSINKAYYKSNSNLTTVARQFRYKFLKQLLDYQDQLLAFNKTFDPNKYSLELQVAVEIPESHFWTAKGHVSNRSGDVDNYLKLIIDFLTNEKYCTNQYVDEDMVNVAIDDRYITSIWATKEPSPDKRWNIQLTLRFIDWTK